MAFFGGCLILHLVSSQMRRQKRDIETKRKDLHEKGLLIESARREQMV